MDRRKLQIDELSVDTFEAGALPSLYEAYPTIFTGVDSTCPCCEQTFTCP